MPLHHGTTSLLCISASGAAERTRTSKPCCWSLAFQAGRLPLSHCCRFFGAAIFHTFSLEPTAQKPDTSETRYGCFLAAGAGVEPTNPSISGVTCFRDRTAQPLAIPAIFNITWYDGKFYKWRRGWDSNPHTQVFLDYCRISNPGPYHVRLTSPN